MKKLRKSFINSFNLICKTYNGHELYVRKKNRNVKEFYLNIKDTKEDEKGKRISTDTVFTAYIEVDKRIPEFVCISNKTRLCISDARGREFNIEFTNQSEALEFQEAFISNL